MYAAVYIDIGMKVDAARRVSWVPAMNSFFPEKDPKGKTGLFGIVTSIFWAFWGSHTVPIGPTIPRVLWSPLCRVEPSQGDPVSVLRAFRWLCWRISRSKKTKCVFLIFRSSPICFLYATLMG